jgi:phage head maturation protease
MILKELPTSVLTLAGDGLLASVIKSNELHTNAGKMSCRVVLTTEDDDRSNDRVIPKGIILDDHRKNPVALFNHNKNAPIGRFEDRLGAYTVKLRSDRELVGEIYFNQSSQFAQDVFRAVESKVFGAVSIGFMPVEGKIEKRHNRGHIYHAARMVEGSIVVIGDNQNALVEFVEKRAQGKMICKELADMITPYIEPRPASVVGGWTETITTPSGILISRTPIVKAAAIAETTLTSAELSQPYPAPTAPLGDPLNPYPSFASLNVETAKQVKAGDYVRDGDGNAVVKSVKCIKRTASVPRDEHNSRSTAKDTLEYEVVAITVENARGETVVHKVGGLENAMTIHRLKPKSLPSYLTKAVQFRNTQSRFLPGLRRKAMDEYDDPNGGVALEDPTMEGFIPEEDEGSGMKAGAEFNHGLADILTQAVAFIEDGKGTLDNATVLKNAEKVAKQLGKALAALHAGHGDYLSEHPDQPALPGNEGVGEDMGDEDDEDTDDEDDDESDDLDIEDDNSESDADDTGDDSGDDKPKKKKKKPAPFEKAFSGRGYLNSYWEDVKLKAVRGDGPIVTKAIAELKELAGTKTGPAAKRVQEVVKSLSSVLVVKSTPNKESPAVVADESMPFAGPEWQAFFAGSETIGT